MEDHFKNIYATKAELYERLIAREDARGNLFGVINEICPLSGIDVVEFGVGTGRIPRIVGVLAKHVYSGDISHHMLTEAARVLELTGLTNWGLFVSDNRAMPVPRGIADLAIEGWSFGHTVGWAPDNWREEIARMIAEMHRVLKPGGTAIILETMGTGSRKPQPPTPQLAEFFRWLEQEQGFAYQWIRTDYQFESVDEADELTRFFFGDDLANEIREKQMLVLPECTGVWWRKFD